MTHETSRPLRALIVVLDSAGVGAMPDAREFGDEGANTLGHIAGAVGGLQLPTLQSLGLGDIIAIDGTPPATDPRAWHGKAAERSPAKDTILGHWEIAGCVADRPFPLYPKGFPDDLVRAFCDAAGLEGVLGNRPASGTRIIEELGDAHARTGRPILYTSADSVFQVAAHEEVVPLPRLYAICRAARELLTGHHQVGRVIARPFVGTSGNYTRTANRKDYPVQPPHPTLLDHLQQAGRAVAAVGKIGDIFAHRGITDERKTHSNAEGMAITLNLAETLDRSGLIFTNLVDFDMLYGHRNDPEGYAQALRAFDAWLPQLLDALSVADLLIITADHGCDPTMPGTDHTREYVPILAYGGMLRPGASLGVRDTFADVAATVSEFLGLGGFGAGRSFLGEMGEPISKCRS